jgi:putative thioredoxin
MSSQIADVTELDFEQKVLLASTQRPVLVDFWAPWCGPCRQLAPVLERIAAEFAGRLDVVKVNTDEQMQLAALFGIRSLPTVLLIRDGRPIDGFMGAQPESVIRELIAPHVGEAAAAVESEPEPALPPADRVADLRARVAAEPDKGELKLDLAEALIETGETAEATAILDALPPDLSEGDKGRRLRALLDFGAIVRDAPPLDQLARIVADDPTNLRARHHLGVRLLFAGQAAAALEEFLEIMRRDRAFEDDLGRRTLIEAFRVVDDPDLVSATRRRMSALIF